MDYRKPLSNGYTQDDYDKRLKYLKCLRSEILEDILKYLGLNDALTGTSRSELISSIIEHEASQVNGFALPEFYINDKAMDHLIDRVTLTMNTIRKLGMLPRNVKTDKCFHATQMGIKLVASSFVLPTEYEELVHKLASVIDK